MKEKKSKLFKICLALFIVGILIFATINILSLFVEANIAKIVFEILSIISQIMISTGGISFLVEITSLKQIVDNTISEYSNQLLDKSLQIDYLKNNYNEDKRRELLYLSYLSKEDYQKLVCTGRINDLVPGSFEKILQKLITSVYAKLDKLNAFYDFEKNCIVKTTERELTLINLFGVKNDFKINSYFNDIDGDSDLVELTDFSINGKQLDITKYIEKGKNDNDESSYKHFWRFYLPDIQGQETTIKYKIKSKLPIDDKSYVFTSNYMVKDFRHKIFLTRKSGFNNLDVVLFSLVSSMTNKSNNFKYDIKSLNPNSNYCEITGNDWLFPSDGYIISFR